MANYRQIHTKIWKDGWFLDLPAEHKLLFIYLFSNERANLIGLYDLPVRVIEFETGMSSEIVAQGLRSLASAGKVHYQDGWVWVTNLLRYNATNKQSPKIQAHIINAIEELPDIPLKHQLIAYYRDSIPYIYGMIPDRTEQEQEQETEQDQEQEQEQATTTEQEQGLDAAECLRAVLALGITEPKASQLVRNRRQNGGLPTLVQELEAWITHFMGTDGVKSPIGLAITQVETGIPPPLVASGGRDHGDLPY